MTDTQKPVLLATRREVILRGAVGLVTLVGFGSRLAGRVFAETRSPQSMPALEEGPYWVDETTKAFHRTDLRANVDGSNVQSGLPLHLALTISYLKNGVATPLPNAFVYLWSANASGVYSDEAQMDSARDTYLRGYQVTDAKGNAKFVTLYPGWYGGRTIHIHARIRTYPHNDPTQKPLHDFETQFFFDDTVSDHVMTTVSPYNQRPDRDTRNSNDHVYQGASLDGTGSKTSGDRAKLSLAQTTSHAQASFHMVMDLSKHARSGMPPGGFGGPPPDGGFGGPPPGPPPDGWGGPPPDGPPPDGPPPGW